MSGVNTLSDNRTLALPYPASVAVAVNDLMYWDASTRRARNLTQKATLASEALDQVDVAARFLGASTDQRLVTETDDGAIRVVRIEGIYDIDCVSQTFNLHDKVGVTWAGGSSLVNQMVTFVPTLAQAIGIVIQDYPVATTRVRLRLLSRYCWDLLHGYQGIFGASIAAKVIPDGNYSVLVSDPSFLSMAPTTGRTITLPPESVCAGARYYFTNNAAAANSVTFQGNANPIKGNGVVAQNKTADLWCDGTNWNSLVSA